MDLTKLTFDQVNIKIMKERRKWYAINLAEPLFVTMKKEIILHTTINLEMIVSIGTDFVTTIELNVDRMRKKIIELQSKIHAFEQRVVKEEEDKRRMEE